MTNHASDFAKHWLLNNKIIFLNHGSFGACPIEVLEYQTHLRNQFETDPIQFLDREGPARLKDALDVLAEFLHVNSEDLAFVPNVTAGVNAVLRSLVFNKGDRILITDHAYRACTNAALYLSHRFGVEVDVVAIPFPISDPALITEKILDAVTPRTRLALVDHITSPTAMVLPIHEIVKKLDAAGVDTLVDGAHAPGMVDLDVAKIGAAYYVGNCHKWVCAPKGAGFLWVRQDRKTALHPVAISLGYRGSECENERFRMEFGWTGTDDPTPYFSVPKAIEFMGGLLPGGWDELRKRNHALALAGRKLLCEKLEIEPPCPDSMIGSMFSIALPDLADDVVLDDFGRDPFGLELYKKYKIEAPIHLWPKPPKRLIRFSFQAYNTKKQVEILAEALKESFL